MSFNLSVPGIEESTKNEEFNLSLPSNEEIKKEVIEATKAENKEIIEIQNSADQYVKNVMQLSSDDVVNKNQAVKAFEEFGVDLMKTSESKNKMLDFQIKSLYGKSEGGNGVANALLNLQKEVKDIDPSGVDFAKKGLLGKFFNPVKDYFAKYKKAGDVIENLVDDLQKGSDMLKRDNITLGQEMEAMRTLTKNINKSIIMGQTIDEKLVTQIEYAKSQGEDSEKIKFVEEELLFPIRQRIIDLQTILSVNQQGFMALDIIRKNNKELIRGVERAKVVTINALKIAVVVAKALADQEIVLKKIQVLNETTNNLIAGTAERLKTQGVEIQKQASEAMLSSDVLKKAFADCLEAMDGIAKYRQEALPRMLGTIEEFKELTEKGEEAIKKIEKGNSRPQIQI